jgi:hypothetical protein
VVSFSEADGRCAARVAAATERFKYIYTPRDYTHRLLSQSEDFFDAQCPPRCRDVPDEEFYDLRVDPFEEHNLLKGAEAMSDDAASALARLRDQMTRHLNTPPQYVTVVRDHRNRSGQAQVDDGVREAMRNLGYLE